MFKVKYKNKTYQVYHVMNVEADTRFLIYDDNYGWSWIKSSECTPLKVLNG